ncbi:chaperone protein dnaJ C76, chloroplastic [Selaginella moellendorffii]|uniref:chaperone protein dnaJ C76, chloroplastic n=1 Tax=Selaginella moellendorffii TaxID=88036 RepID=UPI000D1CCCDD|nr:chaperone protein dnaJ C76, chloroplastic [Selaginella moellendorffii]|eukprot:XP_002994240.2 chaperone protein dnaJ C76, chloroplastic [Selaginella moellendorffii]
MAAAAVNRCVSALDPRRKTILAVDHSNSVIGRDLGRAVRECSSSVFERKLRSYRNYSRSVAARATVDDSSSIGTEAPEEDYYSVLGLEPDATSEDIRKAYYSCMKECHPDLIGDDSGATNFCMFVNEVYEVLSDPEQRMVYDEINGYALTSKNPFLSVTCTKDRVFVDEVSCIGCKNCVNTAPCTFAIEEEHGRARVVSQSGDASLSQIAIESCPVDCIHWVSAPQLALLEDEMRRVERVSVGVMLSGMGYQSADVFATASTRWEKKQAKARIRAMNRAANARNSSMHPWWQGMWNQTMGTRPEEWEKQAGEKRNRAAAAARRWREYSRRGFYGRPTQILPDNKQDNN